MHLVPIPVMSVLEGVDCKKKSLADINSWFAQLQRRQRHFKDFSRTNYSLQGLRFIQ